MKCSFSLFQLCFYCKHRGSGQQYVAALFCRLQLEHFNCCLMREHLALSRWPQGLVIPLSTGSVLLVKDRVHIKDKTAVLKGQRMNCSARNHPSPRLCTGLGSPSPTEHLHSDLQSNWSLFSSDFLRQQQQQWPVIPGDSDQWVTVMSYLPHESDDTLLTGTSIFFMPVQGFLQRTVTDGLQRTTIEFAVPQHHIRCNLHLFSNKPFMLKPLEIYRIMCRVQRIPTYHTPSFSY